MDGTPSRARVPIRTRVNLAFALAVGVLLAIAAASYQSVTSLAETGQWIGHTHEVLAAIDAVAAATTAADAGTRGYALTGEERFLEAYQSGARGAEAALAALRRLTADNLAEQGRADRLEPLLREHLARLADTVAIRREQSGAAAAERVKAGQRHRARRVHPRGDGGDARRRAEAPGRARGRQRQPRRPHALDHRDRQPRGGGGHGAIEPAHLPRDRAAARDRPGAARLRGALPAAREPQPGRDRAHPPGRRGARVQRRHGQAARLRLAGGSARHEREPVLRRPAGPRAARVGLRPRRRRGGPGGALSPEGRHR